MNTDGSIVNGSTDRIRFNTETGRATVKKARTPVSRKVNNVVAIELKTSVSVSSRASSKTVKYSFESPVSVETSESDTGTILYVDDAK